MEEPNSENSRIFVNVEINISPIDSFEDAPLTVVKIVKVVKIDTAQAAPRVPYYRRVLGPEVVDAPGLLVSFFLPLDEFPKKWTDLRDLLLGACVPASQIV